jgi:hypothetical protein
MALVTGDKAADSSKPDRRRLLVRGGLSAFLLFHFVCAVISPNRGAYPVNPLTQVVDVYSGLTGFWATWGFFAPDPGPQATIEYEVFDEQGASVEKGAWPEMQTGFFKVDRNLRRIAATQLMTFLHPDLAGNMLIPYFCNGDSRAHSVRLTSAVYSFPKESEVVEGKRTFGDDVDTKRKVLTYDFCPATGGSKPAEKAAL